MDGSSTLTSSPSLPTAPRRWDIIDIARGAAICAMVVFHGSWDLSNLRLAPIAIGAPGWQWFARLIAGSFLVLVGIGLCLAHAHGFRRSAFLKRLLKIGGSAALVTLATFYIFPDSYIFFGILHCIALSSVLALPFLRLPWPVTVLVGLLCFAAPFILIDPFWDKPWLDWLGLGSTDPVTNDYVPIFPWFGLVLLGLVVGKALLSLKPWSLAGWQATDPLSRSLKWFGRKSLPIYLLHQPILYGLLSGALYVTGPNPRAEAAPFQAQCEASCAHVNADAGICPSACSCIVDNLRRSGIWPHVLDNTVTPDHQLEISRTAQQCLRSTLP